MNYQKKANFRFTIAVLSASVFLTGCQLTNPYIDDAQFVDSNSSSVCTPLTTDAATALSCSTQLKSKYLSAMGEQAELSTWTGIGLIPLTAFTIGFAANGESASKISDFALGTAGLYSLSSWLSTPERTKVYALGHQAIQCAEQVSLPLLVNSKTGSANIKLNVKTLDKILASASALLKQEGDTKNKVLLGSAINEAKIVKSKAFALTRRFDLAPSALVATSQRINSSLNLALSDSVQSLSALPSILNSMGDLYSSNKESINAYIPLEPDNDDDKKQGEQEDKSEEQKHQDIQSLVKELEEATFQLQSLVDSHTPEPSESTLKSCGIDTTNIMHGLSMTPTNLEFIANDINVKSISINGGTGKYGYDSDSIFEITQPAAFGGILQIKLKNTSATPGSYFIKVHDSAGRTMNIQVIIKPAPQDS